MTTADSVCAQEVILNGKFQNIQCLYEIFIEIRKRQIFSTTSVEELKSAKRTSSSSCKTTRLMASLFKAWNGICVKTKVSIMKSWKRISIFFLEIGEIRKLQPGEKNAIFCIYNFANHLQERVHSIFSPDTPRAGLSFQVLLFITSILT